MARVSDAHLEARRQSILAAATKLFTQKGIAAATMAEIADEAGISPGAIYRYFENKDELARGCMNHSAEAIKMAWENPHAAEMSFSELSQATFEACAGPGDAIDTHLFLERSLVALREDDREMLEEFSRDYDKVVDGINLLMSAEYGGRLGDINVRQLGEALYAFYWGTRLMKLLRPETEPVAQLKEVRRLIERALEPGESRS